MLMEPHAVHWPSAHHDLATLLLVSFPFTTTWTLVLIFLTFQPRLSIDPFPDMLALHICQPCTIMVWSGLAEYINTPNTGVFAIAFFLQTEQSLVLYDFCCFLLHFIYAY